MDITIGRVSGCSYKDDRTHGEQCDEAACREHPNTRAQGQTITDADKRKAYPVMRRTQ